MFRKYGSLEHQNLIYTIFILQMFSHSFKISINVKQCLISKNLLSSGTKQHEISI